MGQPTIFINGRFLTQGITGVQRYAREVVKAIDAQLAAAGDVRLLLPNTEVKSNIPDLNHIRVIRKGVLKGHAWEQFELPYHSRNGVLLNLCNPAPIFKTRQVVLMHDVIVFAVPGSTSLLFRTWHKTIFNGVSRNARTIVTDSQFSKDEIRKYLGTAPGKIQVIHAGCDHMAKIEPDYSIIASNKLDRRPFIFAVSSLNPNKNFASVVKAMELIKDPDFDLVIAGGINPAVFSQNKADFPKSVKYLGYVTDQELKALYSSAACFIYPSFYEGFGLPPLEAMCCGAPVIASNTSSLPEVCGDAVRYINPGSVESIAEAIHELTSSSELRAQLKVKGRERAQLFKWSDTAVKIYEACLSAV